MVMSNAAHLASPSPSPVAAAVEPLRAAAVERARQDARERPARILAHYESHPEHFTVPRLTFTNKRQVETCKRNLAALRELTIASHPARGGLELHAPSVERFVARAGEDASNAYTAFIAKLESKVGPCDRAELLGEHVWGHSTLVVTKGEKTESWRTQQIINVSKLGRPFNQWPTRKLRTRAR